MIASQRGVLGLLLALVVACEDERGRLGGGGGDATSASTAEVTSTGAAGTAWCEAPWELVPQVAVPVSRADGSCMDSDRPETLDVCATDRATDHPKFECFVSAEGPQTAWVFVYDKEVILDPAEWSACPESLLPEGEPHPPPPCFAEGCVPPVESLGQDEVWSSCSVEATRAKFACGAADSPWDDGCCRRPGCEDVACAEGTSCRSVSPEALVYCWSGASLETCDCGGLPGGPDVLLCFPD